MNYLSQVVKTVQRGDSLPAEPQWVKWIHRNLSSDHCSKCLQLHKCWFAKNATPKHPHHEYCRGTQTIRIINEIDGDVVGEKVIQYHNGKVMQTGASPLLV